MTTRTETYEREAWREHGRLQVGPWHRNGALLVLGDCVHCGEPTPVPGPDGHPCCSNCGREVHGAAVERVWTTEVQREPRRRAG